MKKALFTLIGLCLAGSGLAQTNPHPAFNAFMQQTVGNNVTVNFASGGTPVITPSAPLGVPNINNFGVNRTAQGVFIESLGAVRVPNTNSTIPVQGRIKLSGQILGRTLVRSLPFIAGMQAGSELHQVWSQAGLTLNPQTGQITTPSQLPTVSQGWQFRAVAGTWRGPIRFTPLDACNAALAAYTLHSFQRPGAICVPLDQNINDITIFRVQNVNPTHTMLYLNVVRSASTICPRGHFIVNNQCTASAPQELLTDQQIADRIASQSGWPDSKILAATAQALSIPQVADQTVPELQQQPLALTFPGGSTAIQIGDPQTTIQETPLPNSQTKRVTTTVQQQARTTDSTSTTSPSVQFSQRVTERTQVLDSNGTVLSDTVTSTTDRPLPPEEQTITCGLPNTPPCRIDERTTAQSTASINQEGGVLANSFRRLFQPITNILNNPEQHLPTLPDVNWTFRLPSDCQPIQITAFGQGLKPIDVCKFKPMFHSLMSVVWVMAGIFAAIGIFWRDIFSD